LQHLAAIPLNDLLSGITFKFYRLPVTDPSDVTTSYTRKSLLGEKTIVKIFYSELEGNSRPQLILGRVYHEVTHAIRFELVQRFEEVPEVPEELKKKTTPNKAVMDRSFCEPLFKLENPDFHSGYWMEHKLLGGIWVTLTGHLVRENDHVEKIPDEGLICKLRRKTGERKTFVIHGVKSKKSDDFFELEGLFPGDDENWRSFYHSGYVVTRSDPSEECSRTL